jgi:hypothetical protein
LAATAVPKQNAAAHTSVKRARNPLAGRDEHINIRIFISYFVEPSLFAKSDKS